MTDNTQELSEIIREMRYRVLEDNGLTVNGLTTIEQESMQAILDWHNKQTSELLDRLVIDTKLTYDGGGDVLDAVVDFIVDERNKLKEGN